VYVFLQVSSFLSSLLVMIIGAVGIAKLGNGPALYWNCCGNVPRGTNCACDPVGDYNAKWAVGMYCIVTIFAGLVVLLSMMRVEVILKYLWTLVTVRGNGCWLLLCFLLCLGLAGQLGIIGGAIVGFFGLVQVIISFTNSPGAGFLMPHPPFFGR